MRRPSYPRTSFGLNMTPMIDVVFQLLIFFVCTVEFSKREDVLAANLVPVTGVPSKTTHELDLGRIEIDVSATEVVTRFQGRAKALGEPGDQRVLRQLVQQLQDWSRVSHRIPVRIQGQLDTPTGVLVQVYDACLQAGFADVGIAQTPREP
jgi:biopolymer transport protein ExbD